jgi:hypothetical protein
MQLRSASEGGAGLEQKGGHVKVADDGDVPRGALFLMVALVSP